MTHRRSICGLVLALLLPACSMETGATLEGVRILDVAASPPALVPPGTVTATIHVFDDQFRVPEVRWYLSLNPAVDRLPELRLDLSQPDAVTPGSALIYLGAGTTMTGEVPEISDALLPEGDLFDTFPLSLIASVRVGDAEYKALRRIRLIVPELVRRTLRRQLEEAGTPREPTDAEIDAAIRLRLNRNPVIRTIRTAVAPADGGYTIAMTKDLADRRQAATAPAVLATLPVGDRALRLEPAIYDPDLTRVTEVGEPGYNKLEIHPLATAGTFYPLSLTGFDWAPFAVRKHGLSRQDLEPQTPELVTVALPLFDRQGGTALAMLEIDAAAPPRPPHRGAVSSILLAEGRRMQWLRDDAGVVPTTITAGTRLRLIARVWQTPVPPHGVTAVVTQATPTTDATTHHLTVWSADPARRNRLYGTAVTFVGDLVRIWQAE